MPNHPALEYAEVILGVHQCYEEAQKIENQLADSVVALIDSQAKRRSLDDQIESREMDLVIEHRGHHADMSEAAFTRHMKEVHYKDDQLKSLRSERAVVASVVSSAEVHVDFERMRLKVKVARMEELGGYLHYLGAVKNAEVPPPLSPVPGMASE